MKNYPQRRKRFSILFIVLISIGCLPNILSYFNSYIERFSPPFLYGLFCGVFMLELILVFKTNWLVNFIVKDDDKDKLLSEIENHSNKIKIGTLASGAILTVLYVLWFLRF